MSENPLPIPPAHEVTDDPKKPYKAYISAVLTLVAVVVYSWITDTRGTTAKEFGEWVLAGLVASGLVGGGTFAVKNPLKVRRRR
jgi:Flp pilus assembly pilin Flp